MRYCPGRNDRNHDLTFSNPLFDIDEDFTSSDESFSEEDVPNENFKIFSNPLFDLDEEITSTKVDQIDDEVLENTNSIPLGIEYPCFNAESDLLESLLQQDTSINDSQKIDSLLDEFTGELTLLQSIPPGIGDVNLDPEGDILFLESLLYDNSSPRPPKEFNSGKIQSEVILYTPYPVEDSDSLMEEIEIFLDGDGSIPSGIKSGDYDSEDDDNSTSRPEFESFHVDYPDSGDSTIDVVEDIPVDVPNILPTHPTLHMDFDFIPSHNDLGSDLDVSSPFGDRNQIYDPGICIEVESTRFLATHSPVIVTFLPFSSENEDKAFLARAGSLPDCFCSSFLKMVSKGGVVGVGWWGVGFWGVGEVVVGVSRVADVEGGLEGERVVVERDRGRAVLRRGWEVGSESSIESECLLEVGVRGWGVRGGVVVVWVGGVEGELDVADGGWHRVGGWRWAN
ncbi:hypothetical protein Tco_0103255 [Tanacetum coccineum]